MKRVVCNASPLIALVQIAELDLLRAVFGTLAVPSAVQDEVAPTLSLLPNWIEVMALTSSVPTRILNARLGRGESEAIALALETEAPQIILDDLAARQLAISLGLNVVGTIGVLKAAHFANLIPVLKPRFDALIQADFRLSPGIYQQVLRDVGEL